VARPRHRLSEPEIRVDRATDDEVLALLKSCRSARDRFVVLAMSRAGLRRGEVCGLRREDMHFVTDASGLGCAISGPHLHVRRRANVNGAWAKPRRSRAVPVDDLLVRARGGQVLEPVAHHDAHIGGARFLISLSTRSQNFAKAHRFARTCAR
jgi:integrase/recombinase XerD